MCLLAHSCVQQILCFASVLLVFVLCILCYQFLCIVHFWLLLRNSLTCLQRYSWNTVNVLVNINIISTSFIYYIDYLLAILNDYFLLSAKDETFLPLKSDFVDQSIILIRSAFLYCNTIDNNKNKVDIKFIAHVDISIHTVK